jgi:hypothetical protein
MTTQPASGVSVPSSLPPRIDRRAVSLGCTLTRPAGSPMRARTIDLGPTGMRVVTERPLAVDETVAFDLPCGEVRIHGEARVACLERPDIYALRFVALQQVMARCLQDVMAMLEAAS